MSAALLAGISLSPSILHGPREFSNTAADVVPHAVVFGGRLLDFELILAWAVLLRGLGLCALTPSTPTGAKIMTTSATFVHRTPFRNFRLVRPRWTTRKKKATMALILTPTKTRRPRGRRVLPPSSRTFTHFWLFCSTGLHLALPETNVTFPPMIQRSFRPRLQTTPTTTLPAFHHYPPASQH